MKKGNIKVIVVVIFCLLSAGVMMSFAWGRGKQKEKKYVFKLGHMTNEENSWHKACLKLAEVAKEKSKGKIEIKVFPNEQLGKEMDMISGIQAGAVDMTITGESLQNWAPLAALLAIPYALRDSDQMKKVIEGPIGKEINKQIIEKTQLRPLCWFERGPRDLTTNRPIKSPDDLHGLILRVPNVPLFVKVWNALGAKPTPMAFSEVFTGLQSKTIEGQENPIALIDSASFFEVQKYLNKTEHVRSWIYVVIGDKQYQSLPKNLQKVMDDAAKEAQAYEHKIFLETEDKIMKKLIDKGMQVVEVNKEAFMAKAKDAVLASLTPEQKDLYIQMQKIK